MLRDYKGHIMSLYQTFIKNIKMRSFLCMPHLSDDPIIFYYPILELDYSGFSAVPVVFVVVAIVDAAAGGIFMHLLSFIHSFILIHLSANTTIF